MNEFLRMGGYAFYVWSSYGIALLILLWCAMDPLLKLKKLLREIKLKRKRSNGGAV